MPPAVVVHGPGIINRDEEGPFLACLLAQLLMEAHWLQRMLVPAEPHSVYDRITYTTLHCCEYAFAEFQTQKEA